MPCGTHTCVCMCERLCDLPPPPPPPTHPLHRLHDLSTQEKLEHQHVVKDLKRNTLRPTTLEAEEEVGARSSGTDLYQGS